MSGKNVIPMIRKRNVFVVGRNYQVETMFSIQKDKANNYYYDILNTPEPKVPDLIVFTGGPDVHPKYYNEKLLAETSFNKDRDNLDEFFWNKFPDTPKVGICRGGQFLNVMSGGAMFQDVNNHGRDHTIRNLLNIEGKFHMNTISVTSTHHQMMIPGPEGTVVAIAVHDKEDRGLATEYLSSVAREKPRFDTEVVWYPKTLSLCYQPHPEYNTLSVTNRLYFFDLINHFFWDKN